MYIISYLEDDEREDYAVILEHLGCRFRIKNIPIIEKKGSMIKQNRRIAKSFLRHKLCRKVFEPKKTMNSRILEITGDNGLRVKSVKREHSKIFSKKDNSIYFSSLKRGQSITNKDESVLKIPKVPTSGRDEYCTGQEEIKNSIINAARKSKNYSTSKIINKMLSNRNSQVSRQLKQDVCK